MLVDRFLAVQNGSDVRGAVIETEKEKKTLSGRMAFLITAAFADYLAGRENKDRSQLRIGVGNDSRITAKLMREACFAGLCGSQVFDCGMITTPAMFQSTILPESHFDGAVMITASHLPYNRSGLKFFTSDGSLEKDQVREVLRGAAVLADQCDTQADLRADEATSLDLSRLFDLRGLSLPGQRPQPFDLKGIYCDHLRTTIKEEVNSFSYEKPLFGLHIVVDAGNGSSGFFADEILKPLGADISGSVYLKPDGWFPNHVPNPEDADAIGCLRGAVKDSGADLGVIFDCDGDRAAVVFDDGREANRNTLIALLASILAEKHPGSTIVTDSITSDELTEYLTEELKLKHLRYKRGYKNVIDKGIELNAAGEDCELAIETSGHGAFKENHFSDDGAYIAVKIICCMARLRSQGRRLQELISAYREPADAREIRFHIEAEDFAACGSQVLEDFRAFAQADSRFHIVEPNYEGIRISFKDSQVSGWLLLRKSLHDPVLPMNIEAREKGGVDVIWNRVKFFFEKYPLRAD